MGGQGTDFDGRFVGALWARFGEPEVVYKPSPGQTFAGVLLGCAFAVAACSIAFLADGLTWSNRAAAAGFGVAGIGFAYWVYRLRRWRLAVCPGGLVQVRAWGVDRVAWAEVREVVETRVKGEASLRKLTIVGPSGGIVVSPINFSGIKELYASLLEAAKRREIPIHTKWFEPPDPVV